MSEVKKLGQVGKLGGAGKLGSSAKPAILGKANREAAAAEAAMDLKAELDRDVRDLERNLNESMNQVHGRLEAEADADFFINLIFQTGEQREAFLAALKWDTGRDGDLYLDGRKLAKRLNITLPPTPDWKETKVKPAFAAFAIQPPKRGP